MVCTCNKSSGNIFDGMADCMIHGTSLGQGFCFSKAGSEAGARAMTDEERAKLYSHSQAALAPDHRKTDPALLQNAWLPVYATGGEPQPSRWWRFKHMILDMLQDWLG